MDAAETNTPAAPATDAAPADSGAPAPSSAVAADIPSTDAERKYAMWIHIGAILAALVAAVSTGVGSWICPLAVLVMWWARRDRSAFIDDHGRECLNFQISLLI